MLNTTVIGSYHTSTEVPKIKRLHQTLTKMWSDGTFV